MSIINITQTHICGSFTISLKNEPSFFKGHSAPEISTIPDFFSFRLPPQVRWNLYVELCGTSTFSSRTFLWNLGEHTLLRVEPLCGTLWNLNFSEWNLYAEPCGTWTFNSGTLWNLNF